MARMLRPSFSDANAVDRIPQLSGRVGIVMAAPGTRREITPADDHYRMDINLIPPFIDGRAWRLPISGLVERPTRLTLDGFENGLYGPPQHLLITLECISNPVGGDLISTTRWTGVPLRAVLAPFGPKPSARYAAIRSADGFQESVPLDLVMAEPPVLLTYWGPAGRGRARTAFPSASTSPADTA